MKKSLLNLFCGTLLLAGCATSEQPKNSDAEVDVAALEVKVEILTPEQVSVNETVELAAHVSQNGEDVNDAQSVEFEVWESGYRDKGTMIEGVLDKDGVYKAEFTFDHDGVYYMYAHTTARGLHTMPKQQIIVGNPDMSKIKEDTSSEKMDMGDMGHQEHDQSHSENGHSNE